ncbi:MAG: cupin domain-containing protein [Granulosicoccaceae bacterium]
MKINGLLAALVLPLMTLGVTSLNADQEAITNLPTASLSWNMTEEGVGFAPLIGKRFEEAYMAMVKLPAGLVSPAHVKSSNMFGVVVSGTMTHLAVGGDPSLEIPLTQGAFYKIPAGMPHISKCISDVYCVTFLYQDGPFDFVPVEQ